MVDYWCQCDQYNDMTWWTVGASVVNIVTQHGGVLVSMCNQHSDTAWWTVGVSVANTVTRYDGLMVSVTRHGGLMMSAWTTQ